MPSTPPRFNHPAAPSAPERARGTQREYTHEERARIRQLQIDFENRLVYVEVSGIAATLATININTPQQ